MSSGKNAAGSMLVVAEYFDREDNRFAEELRKVFHAPSLAGFVDRWKQDPRPWAKQQVLVYLQQPLNVPGHHPVVKRLFKWAEATRDQEQMAAFMAAFDCLIRRIRKRRRRYEWVPETRQSLIHETEYLSSNRDSLLPPLPRKAINPRTGERMEIPPPRPYFIPSMRLFSCRTRRYLRRRVWRYFRRLGFQHPTEYVPAITAALLRYADDDLKQPENLLDSWSLMHACFGRHEALEFPPLAVRLKEGRSLAELSAAPRFAALWAEEAASPSLLRLLLEAPSRTVRVWARQLLERLHLKSLEKLPIETLLRLLEHDDAELQQFGATLLSTLEGVDRWPIATWLRLLELRDPTALAIVCEQLTRRVSSDRLDLAQTLQLATARATSVARIGLQFLKARKWEAVEDRRALSSLGSARCAAVAGELTKWALNVVGTAERYERDVVLRFFDSLLEPMRAAVGTWFESSAAAQDDPVLWSRLMETPFEDVRLRIVEQLQRRAARPRIDSGDLAPLWTGVLLGVHRGGRHKLKAIEQLTAAITDRPELAPQLVPVLGVAIRSIRRPEHRAGLAAVAVLIDRQPSLAGIVRQVVPELTFTLPSLTT